MIHVQEIGSIYIKVVQDKNFPGQILTRPFFKHLLEGGLAKVFGETKNWGRWSEMVAVILPQIMSTRMDNIWQVRIGDKSISKFICWFMLIIVH